MKELIGRIGKIFVATSDSTYYFGRIQRFDSSSLVAHLINPGLEWGSFARIETDFVTHLITDDPYCKAAERAVGHEPNMTVDLDNSLISWLRKAASQKNDCGIETDDYDIEGVITFRKTWISVDTKGDGVYHLTEDKIRAVRLKLVGMEVELTG